VSSAIFRMHDVKMHCDMGDGPISIKKRAAGAVARGMYGIKPAGHDTCFAHQTPNGRQDSVSSCLKKILWITLWTKKN